MGSFEILSISGKFSFGTGAPSSEIKEKGYNFEAFSKILYLPKVRMLIKSL